jgi:hypothetical protein
MESPVFKAPNIRRRSDGSIDIDFYREAGLTERRLVMIRFARGLMRLHRVVIAVLMLAATFYMAPARDGTCWNEIAASGGPHDSAMLPQPLAGSRTARREANEPMIEQQDWRHP